jgi:hypothetical protein
MTRTEAAAALAAATTPEALADLNDWAVNTIRDNYDAPRAVRADMVRGEITRVEGKTLAEYLRTSRSGSPYRLNRKIKVAVYVLLATR